MRTCHWSYCAVFQFPFDGTKSFNSRRVVSVYPVAMNAGLVGLSITYTMTLMGLFQWGVRQSAEVENQVS